MMSNMKYRQGFTLIELLTATAILVVLVLLMSQIFTNTHRMWTLGTKRVLEAQEARVVMDFLVQGFSTAMADDLISFKMHSETGEDSLSVSAYGEETDSIAFLSYTQTPPWGGTGHQARRRATTQFVYYVDYMEDDARELMDIDHPDGPRYRLVRRRGTRLPHTVDDLSGRRPPGAGLLYSAYQIRDWWLPRNVASHDEETVAINVVAFELWAFTAGGEYVYNFDSTVVGEPPLWVDLYLEVMGNEEITQLAQLWRQDPNAPAVRDFRERHARRYSARVYLRNWEGYML